MTASMTSAAVRFYTGSRNFRAVGTICAQFERFSNRRQPLHT